MSVGRKFRNFLGGKSHERHLKTATLERWKNIESIAGKYGNSRFGENWVYKIWVAFSSIKNLLKFWALDFVQNEGISRSPIQLVVTWARSIGQWACVFGLPRQSRSFANFREWGGSAVRACAKRGARPIMLLEDCRTFRICWFNLIIH